MNDQIVNDLKPALGREYPPADEGTYIAEMVADLQKQLKQLYPDGQMNRQAHPKMHGCVKAEFTVLDNIDKDLKVGIFKEPKTYDAYIRFSNADSKINADSKKDVRGMAIKIMGVPGKKLHTDSDNQDVQDFVLISHDIFISKNVKDFHNVIKSLTAGKLALLGFMIRPSHFTTLLRLIGSFKQFAHIINIPYWSVTPYQFGNGKAVKYQVDPANETAPSGEVSKTDRDYLRTNMIKTLSEQDIQFDFSIQLQTDAVQMPVEDPTVRWKSTPIKVARIRIPKQTFATEEQDHMGNNFSFSPWHSLPEHKPLGGINRARGKIYEVMSEFWHDRNSLYSTKK